MSTYPRLSGSFKALEKEFFDASGNYARGYMFAGEGENFFPTDCEEYDTPNNRGFGGDITYNITMSMKEDFGTFDFPK